MASPAEYATVQWGYGPGLLECKRCGALVVPKPDGPDLHVEWHDVERRLIDTVLTLAGGNRSSVIDGEEA